METVSVHTEYQQEAQDFESSGDVNTGEISSEARQIIIQHSVLAGLVQLIPLPFIDDLLTGQAHERMSQKLFEAHEMRLDENGQDILRDTPSRFFQSALTTALMFPIKKVLKKVIFIFTIKGLVDVSSSVFHDGWMVARALEGDYLSRKQLALNDEETLKTLRRAILLTREQMDTRPLEHILKSAWRSSYGAVKTAHQSLSERFGFDDAVEREVIDEVIQQPDVQDAAQSIHEQVFQDERYFMILDRTFYENLQNVA